MKIQIHLLIDSKRYTALTAFLINFVPRAQFALPSNKLCRQIINSFVEADDVRRFAVIHDPV